MSDERYGPPLPCGCYESRADCLYLRRVLGRSKRQRPMPCTWMTTNGFTRSAESFARAEAK